MKNFRKMCRGEKGFTLIELLVVIIILGVLAAVVTLAVTQFIGKGSVEAARTEMATAQTAIEAALADASLVGHGTFDVASVAPAQVWDGLQGTAPSVAAGVAPGLVHPAINAADYMRGGGTKAFKATYAVNVNGDITAGVSTGWTRVAWDAAQLTWIKG